MTSWQLFLLLITMIAHEIQSMYYPLLNDGQPNNINVKSFKRHVSDADVPPPCKSRDRKDQKKGLWWTLPIPPVELEYEPEKTLGILGVPAEKNQAKTEHKQAPAQHAPQQKSQANLKAPPAQASNLTFTTEKSKSPNAPAPKDSKEKSKSVGFVKTGHSGVQQKQGIVGEKGADKAQVHGTSNVVGCGSKSQQVRPAVQDRAHFNTHRLGKKALTGNTELDPQNNGISVDFNNANYYAHFQDEPNSRGLLSDHFIADYPYDQGNLQDNEELPRMYRMPQYSNEIQNMLSDVPEVGMDQQKNILFDTKLAPSALDENWNSQDLQRYKQNIKLEDFIL